MKPLWIFLCCLIQIFMVVGQLFFKRAMTPKGEHAGKTSIRWGWLALGMFFYSLWFFIWLGILGDNDLSQVFPFEGLNSAVIVIAAWWFLNEKLPARGWIGIALISAGIVLVSRS